MGRLSCMEGGEAVTNEAEAALDFIQVANAHILPISCVPGVMVDKPWPKRVDISRWFDRSKDGRGAHEMKRDWAVWPFSYNASQSPMLQ